MAAEQVWESTMSKKYTYTPVMSKPESVKGRTEIKCVGGGGGYQQGSGINILVMSKKKKKGTNKKWTNPKMRKV